MEKHTNSLNKSFERRQGKDKKLVLQSIIKQVEKGTGLTLQELKKQYNEEQLFFVGLKHVTTTKKAICKALDIPIEAGCRYKRHYEKANRLVQSSKEVVCPYTKHFAHLLSTNPKEFQRLKNIKSNQIKMF